MGNGLGTKTPRRRFNQNRLSDFISCFSVHSILGFIFFFGSIVVIHGCLIGCLTGCCTRMCLVGFFFFFVYTSHSIGLSFLFFVSFLSARYRSEPFVCSFMTWFGEKKGGKKVGNGVSYPRSNGVAPRTERPPPFRNALRVLRGSPGTVF